MAFHFRQFDVEDERSTLRIGTDAMLLGSWACPAGTAKILDIGTGCGVLALMMAQKSGASVEAIDVDPESINEAAGNFACSPWNDRLSAILTTLQHFSANSVGGYDFIITNPPYFANLLKSPSARKNNTRHSDSLTHNELVSNVARLLAPGGSFALILPAGLAPDFRILCEKNGLHLRRLMNVCPNPSAVPVRTLMEYARYEGTFVEEPPLTLRSPDGAFTPEYLALTDAFHNF